MQYCRPIIIVAHVTYRISIAAIDGVGMTYQALIYIFATLVNIYDDGE